MPSMAAEGPAQPKLAVMPLWALRGVDKDVVAILTGIITTLAGASHLFSQVISADEVAAVLKAEKLKDALGCRDVACAAEIGGALGVDQVITGSVGKLGSKITIQLTLFDNTKMRVRMRAQESVKNDEDLFEAAINAALSKLFGKPVGGASESSSAAGPTTDIGEEASAWQATGAEMVLVRFSSIHEGATVLVDGKVACADTSKGCSRSIAARSLREAAADDLDLRS